MAAPKHNLYALGNNGGRPMKFDGDPIRLESKCIEYFDWCVKEKHVLTITGLCLFLGITRETMSQWKLKGHKFSDIISRAIQCVEMAYEMKLDTFAFGGAIFALKNINKDYWKERTEQDVNQNINNVAASFGATIHPTQEPVKDSPEHKE